MSLYKNFFLSNIEGKNPLTIEYIFNLSLVEMGLKNFITLERSVYFYNDLVQWLTMYLLSCKCNLSMISHGHANNVVIMGKNNGKKEEEQGGMYTGYFYVIDNTCDMKEVLFSIETFPEKDVATQKLRQYQNVCKRIDSSLIVKGKLIIVPTLDNFIDSVKKNDVSYIYEYKSNFIDCFKYSNYFVTTLKLKNIRTFEEFEEFFLIYKHLLLTILLLIKNDAIKDESKDKIKEIEMNMYDDN